MNLSYDKSTDSLYIELRSLPARRTREIDTDVMLDLGADGDPVGYDIQHASGKGALILSIIMADAPQIAAE
ncbi:MAG TPA: DUF2283 domain-containing protein [Stellaceae bacterium]|jgi:uncharacterized protein YuzE|nr:DUF2283 domain-containing protein [Stellaceae bacterium]